MKVEYICHACLLIDTGDVRIATDPWFAGAAYCDQWHVFPKPVNMRALDAAEVVILSHGHEDHLHEPTLQTLPKTARVFYPYNWYGGTKEYLEGMGFADVREAATHKTYRLTDRTSVTYLANNLDSIVVIESDDQVLVNVNDALHSYPDEVIDFYTAAILKRWPRVDTLFCGFGGASYFPNAIHLEGKDDREIGMLREQLFAHNFCRIASRLRPSVAVPFAADFALLAPTQRWINEIRFPRAHMKSYYRAHFGNDANQPEIHDMYPGDSLIDNQLQAHSPYRNLLKNGDLTHLIDEQYQDEIARTEQRQFITEADAEALAAEIRANVAERAPLFDVEILKRLVFTVRASDVADDGCYNISFNNGQPLVRRSADPSPQSILVLDTSSRILRYSFGSEWGGDALTIGYGCDVQVFDRQTVEAKLDTICVRLLTRHPTAKGQLKKEPVRGIKHLVKNPLLRTWVHNRLNPKREQNLVYDQSVWLLRSKCDVCQICNLPLLTEDFVAQL
ncbi:MAG TPA: MBL fold metallo-hydrolase [Pyrinomonadaceae bacterium]|jgi:hypothetical protein